MGAFKVAVMGYFANPVGGMYLGDYSSTQGVFGQRNEVNGYQGIKSSVQAIDPDATVDYYPGVVGGTSASQLNAGHTGELGEGAFAECTAYTGKPVPASVANPGHVTYEWYPSLEYPTLGLRYTGNYWLDGLAERDPSQPTARIDAVSGAGPDPAETDQRTTTTTMPVPPHPVVVNELDWALGGAPAPTPNIALSLRNLGDLAINLLGAGFDRFADQPGSTITSDDDGDAQLTLEGAKPGSVVTRNGHPVATVDGSGLATVLVPYGRSTIGFTAGRATPQQAVQIHRAARHHRRRHHRRRHHRRHHGRLRTRAHHRPRFTGSARRPVRLIGEASS